MGSGVAHETVESEDALHEVDLADIERVREAGLDPDLEALYRASPAERLDRYLELDFASAAEAFPRWQAAAVIEPTVQSVTVVSRLAYALTKVYLPENAALSDRGGFPSGRPASLSVARRPNSSTGAASSVAGRVGRGCVRRRALVRQTRRRRVGRQHLAPACEDGVTNGRTVRTAPAGDRNAVVTCSPSCDLATRYFLAQLETPRPGLPAGPDS
jgi:hypothetical protein